MNYYKEIKNELVNNEVYKRVKDYSKNKNDLSTYYNVGKLLMDAQGGEARAKYGDGLIKDYSKRLTIELGNGYSTRTLKEMRRFYLYQKGHPLDAQLTWSHYRILLALKYDNKINYYIKEAIKYNLSKRELIFKIKTKAYERLHDNTKSKLIRNTENNIEDFIKNPILIKNSSKYKMISEKVLKRLILEDIDNFLTELGNGFTYIKSEYKIKIGDRYNYIDLLLYNIRFNCYVVVELKVTELKKEHMGQIETYMNYINKSIKGLEQDNTIGIIIVRVDNKFIMEYCSDDRIYKTTCSLL